MKCHGSSPPVGPALSVPLQSSSAQWRPRGPEPTLERIVVDLPLGVHGHDEFQFFGVKRFIRRQLMIENLDSRLRYINVLFPPRFDSLAKHRLRGRAVQYREPGHFLRRQPDEGFPFVAQQKSCIDDHIHPAPRALAALRRSAACTQKLDVLTHRFRNLDQLRWVDIDLAVSGDAAGIVRGHVPGFTKIKRGDEAETLPRISIDFSLRALPPKNGEISFATIRELLYRLRDLGLNIRWVSFDQFQSVDCRQILKQKGFVTGVRSIDRDTEPYAYAKTTLYDGRVAAPKNDFLVEELLSLELDTQKGKIDHRKGASKDVSVPWQGLLLDSRRGGRFGDSLESRPLRFPCPYEKQLFPQTRRGRKQQPST